jgi:cellulose synthase/poly-beta-1,6-N-acetylglucosamine synthase-like glycosyltransferase
MNTVTVAAALFLTLTALPYVLYLSIYAALRPSGSPAEKTESEPTVSIILPTYNEEGIVEKKLDDLTALDYPMDKIEIVVVDSSDDETPDIVRDYFEGLEEQCPDLNLIIEDERRGLAPALNDAYAAAKNEMVVKTDCDSYLADDVLREAAANLVDPEVAAVTGTNAEVLGGSDVEEGYRSVQAVIQTLESHLDSTLIFHGPFSAFENGEIVPIDPNSLADDTELALRMRRNGGRVIFDPSIRYKEASHSDFKKRRKQKDRRGVGLIRLLIQHRDALGRYGRYGKVVLPFNWYFMIVSPWLVVLNILVLTAASVSVFGVSGLGFLVLFVAFVWLGQRDMLHVGQPFYSIFDTQVSLLFAAIELLTRDSDGTWEVDDELREAFD